MNYRRLWGVVAFLAIVTFLVPVWRFDRVFAQASPGYIKLNTVPIAALTYTDTTIVDGNAYQYQVTTFCATGQCTTGTGQPIVGESTPMTGNILAVPVTGVHSITTTWIASNAPGTPTYNIYRIQGQVPNPPGAVS